MCSGAEKPTGLFVVEAPALFYAVEWRAALSVNSALQEIKRTDSRIVF
jgi:hypothetical protein